MNIKDFLSAEGRLRFRIGRATKTLLERYAQHEARMEAADKLRTIGTPEAIFGLARRFSSTSENLGVDQEEKKTIQNILVGFGDEAIEPLKRYVKGHDKITWAVDALKRLIPNDELIPFLFDVLSEGDPVRIRADKATQILKAFEGLEEPSVVEGILPCLESSEDTVRIAAIDALEAYGDERAREALLQTLTDPDEDSVRVKMRIGELFETHGWDVKGFRKKVEASLPEPFRVNAKGRVVR